MMTGAIVLAVCTVLAKPSFATFVMPMWLIAVGIVLMSSVSANGALRDFGDAAGKAVALYYAVQGVIVTGVGTLTTLVFDGATAWPLAACCFGMGLASFVAIKGLTRATGRARDGRDRSVSFD